MIPDGVDTDCPWRDRRRRAGRDAHAIGASQGVRSLLERVLAHTDTAEASSQGDGAARRGLVDEERTPRRRIREIDDQLELLDRLQKEQGSAEQSSEYQVERLRALDVLVPRADLTAGDVTTCPLCGRACPTR